MLKSVSFVDMPMALVQRFRKYFLSTKRNSPVRTGELLAHLHDIAMISVELLFSCGDKFIADSKCIRSITEIFTELENAFVMRVSTT